MGCKVLKTMTLQFPSGPTGCQNTILSSAVNIILCTRETKEGQMISRRHQERINRQLGREVQIHLSLKKNPEDRDREGRLANIESILLTSRIET